MLFANLFHLSWFSRSNDYRGIYATFRKFLPLVTPGDPNFDLGKNDKIVSKELWTSYRTFFSFFATMSGSRVSREGLLKPAPHAKASHLEPAKNKAK